MPLKLRHWGAAALVLSAPALGCGGALPSPDCLFLLQDAQSRSISPENPDGRRGGGSRATLEQGSAGREASELGLGWKVNPYIVIKPGQRVVLGEADGPGIINHIWLTVGGKGEYRSLILRMYWDGEQTPSVEAPIGDFFAASFGKDATHVIDSAMVAVNPESGLNSFWQMPFRRKFRIELENRSPHTDEVYFQIDYTLAKVPPEAAYFHAQFRMVDRLKAGDVYTVLDGIRGRGHYVGTYLTHTAFSPGWWGEGEFKFYLDGDRDFPTINFTGEEDYFLGSYGFRHKDGEGVMRETAFAGRYAGFLPLTRTDLATQYYLPGRERRIAEYRWHVLDPIRFTSDLRVTLQALGWKSPERYRLLEDGYSSVAYWYQTEPHAAFPQLPDDAALGWKPVVPDPPKAAAAGLTIDTPIEDIMAIPAGKALLDRVIPALARHPSYDQFKGMSLRNLQPISDGAITDAMIADVQAGLGSIVAKR